MEEFVEKSENQAVKPKTSKGKLEVFDWLEIIVASVIIVTILFTFVFKVVTISGDSMFDTLKNGERIIISKLFYTPERGDIVVISRNADNSPDYNSSETCIIKRVIATEGQVVDIDFTLGIVSVDGVPLDEPYTYTPTNTRGDVVFPVTVPEGHVFVLGDNRNKSADSRKSTLGDNGMVDERNILGRALLRYLPFDRFGVLVNE
ncbi:MAG: signal peptidase I [Clostridia bacterium]|nr:signal peptidase I [Clostridia bacterium]